MELIKDFERVCSQIAEHVGYNGYIENYQINTTDVDYFWQADDSSISWAQDKEDVLEGDGDIYISEHKGIFIGEDITLALVESSFDNEVYWLVLNSKKEIK